MLRSVLTELTVMSRLSGSSLYEMVDTCISVLSRDQRLFTCLKGRNQSIYIALTVRNTYLLSNSVGDLSFLLSFHVMPVNAELK